MHDYTVKSGLRETVIVTIVGIYIIFAILFAPVSDSLYSALFKHYENTEIVYMKLILSVAFPGIGYAVPYFIYDKFAWKCLCFLHHIPNLNGKWQAEVISELKEPRRPIINMEIKQTWSKIKIKGVSERGTTTLSQSAAIIEEAGDVYLIYSYQIVPDKGQKYFGYNKLLYKPGHKGTNQNICELKGYYCSSKDVSCDLSELFHNTNENMDKLKGCGSKGCIILKKCCK